MTLSSVQLGHCIVSCKAPFELLAELGASKIPEKLWIRNVYLYLPHRRNAARARGGG